MEMFDFVNRGNSDYIDQLYQQYRRDPRSVDARWQAFFSGFEAAGGRAPGAAVAASGAPLSGDNVVFTMGVHDLVHSFRELGHFVADLDPLGHNRPNHPLLDFSEFNITAADLDRPVGQATFLGKTDGTLRDLIEKLRLTYCRTIGVEFTHISDKAQRDWLIQRIEPNYNTPAFSQDDKRWIINELVAAQGFEEFVEKKYVNAKRFGLEGGESFIPILNTLVEEAANLGAEELVFGMAHRGRLNTLAHVLCKPYEIILSEFEGHGLEQDEGDGDVKYHLGYSQDRITRSGRKIHVSMSFNPSHLELVNPVVEGIVRAKQYAFADNSRTRVVPVLIHGDAALAGQGIVMETLALSEMPYWRTGGTLHVVINNQVGFTTLPKQGRFTPYPTDVAKMVQAPIFHVNGDDPEACVQVMKLATAFRQQFHCDVVIDLWCFRKHGHNETDEPSFTQPVMYKQIRAKKSVRDLYEQRLLQQGALAAEEIEQMKTRLRDRLESALATAREQKPRQTLLTLGGLWKGYSRAGTDWSSRTAVPADVIKRVAEGASRLPPGFTVHPKLGPIYQRRLEMGLGKAPIDWAGAEMFALGSLVLEGTPIRFTGQDVQRGTFSHRHATLHDYNNGQKHYPLASLDPNQAPIIFVNTMLSELAVLGFEYGFSCGDPRNLVVWEAQFGDFVNGAQAIIDQFIVAGESKWQKMCGMIMLLPHGYEGQGPEHSYAYLDRFLALCAENNIQVCQPSTPAQYFHAIRRQIHRKFRKPLILMMPKSMLRAPDPAMGSRLEELTQGAYQLVIDDPTIQSREKIRRVLFTSGKAYFTLNSAREKHNVRDVAIVRVEQFYPYPQKEIQAILSRYNRAEEIGWVQEEPRNRGAWTFMDPRLRQILPDGRVLNYFGREESASPATGSYRLHQIEEQEIISHALELPQPQVEKTVHVAPPKAAAEKATPVSD